MSGGRPLEYLVLFTVADTGSHDEGEEGLIVQLAWGVVSIAKNQVRDIWNVHGPCAFY